MFRGICALLVLTGSTPIYSRDWVRLFARDSLRYRQCFGISVSPFSSAYPTSAGNGESVPSVNIAERTREEGKLVIGT